MKIPARIVRAKTGILLDISLGGTPQENTTLVLSQYADVRKLPFPLPAGSVHTAVVTHVLEYLDPLALFAWFDDLHRIMKPRGVVYLSGPYGGDEQQGWLSDPQHRIRVIESTFAWLDPRTPLYALHDTVGRRRPKPWHPLTIARVPGEQSTVSYNVMMQAVDGKPKVSKKLKS